MPGIGQQIGKWAASLDVPGRTPGTKFFLPPKYQTWLDRAFSKPVEESHLVVARKNIKTCCISLTAAAFLLGVVDRPPHWRAIAGSLTSKNTAELKSQISALAEVNDLPLKTIDYPQPGRITGPDHTVLDFLSSDKSSGHSSNAHAVFFDEAGLLDHSKQGLIPNMKAALAGTANGKFLSITVRGFSPVVETARQRRNERAVNYLEFCPTDPQCAIDDHRAWKQANPLLGRVKSLAFMKNACSEALLNNELESSFRTYHLNLPTSAQAEMICSVQDYLRCCGTSLPDMAGFCVLGIDLGESDGLTSGTFFWPVTGRVETFAGWCAIPDIAFRARRDSAGDKYKKIYQEGNLLLTPGRAMNHRSFLEWAWLRVGNYPVDIVCADRFRKGNLEDSLDAAGIGPYEMVWRGLGHRDSSADIRDTKAAILGCEVSFIRSLLLENAISESAIKRDDAGNPKLVGHRRHSRIDPLISTTIALGVGRRTAKAWGVGVGEAA